VHVTRWKGAPLYVAELVEHEQRMVAGAAEMAVVSAPLLALARIPYAFLRACSAVRAHLQTAPTHISPKACQPKPVRLDHLGQAILLSEESV
jgi:hypothetical protein